MQTRLLTILILLLLLSLLVGGCKRSSSGGGAASASVEGDESGPGGGEPGSDNEDPNIVVDKNDLDLTDPNSGYDGTAEPGEEIAFRITIRNTGDFLGRVDITDLRVVPANSLTILSRTVGGNPVADFTQIDVPANSQAVIGGTALVSSAISDQTLIMVGPPTLVPSTPATIPETVVNPENIQGKDTLVIQEEGENPPPPPPDDSVRHTRHPGSILVFPFFRIRQEPGQGYSADTLITVTNSNTDYKEEPSGYMGGTITIHFYFINKYDCSPYERWEQLTPNDTLSLWMGDYLPYPKMTEGWLFLEALDPITGEAIDFDYLVGNAIYFDSTKTTWTQYNPLALRGLTGDRLPTDLDLDGHRDLNGLEYEMLGDNQIIPRFLGSFDEGTDSQHKTELVLLNLSGGMRFESQVAFMVYNDNEQAYSSFYDFQCWDLFNLSHFGVLFTNSFLKSTNHNTDEELDILGNPQVETGWFSMDGVEAWNKVKVIEDPAFVCLLLEWYNNRLVISSPFENGQKQNNGTLWPLSWVGDNED